MNNATVAQQDKTTSFLSHTQGILQRKCVCGIHTAAGGECEECAKKKIGLQRKLTIGASNDPLEREADKVADQVMASPARTARSAPLHIQRYTRQAAEGSMTAPASVDRVLASSGRPLESKLRQDMEQRFGYDFSRVRVHTGGTAERSARDVNAHAYTVGHDVVFGVGAYTPVTQQGRRLIAHELTHVVQQRSCEQKISQPILIDDPALASEKEAERTATNIANNKLPNVHQYGEVQVARLCTDPSICSPATAVPGSAEDFGETEATAEIGPRERRGRMTTTRAGISGHAGHARQLEEFLDAQERGRLNNIHGIFIDHDLSPDTGAMVDTCANWITYALPPGSPTPPAMTGATRECVFVHGRNNQEALEFNTTTNATIRGIPRELWRVSTLQILIHETEHPRFETATARSAAPPGITSTTCSRANIGHELSELAAILSEFPTVYRSAASESDPMGPVHTYMENWFVHKFHTGGENIEGVLLEMGCSCECPEVDAFVIDTFNKVTRTGAWSVSERSAFNSRARTELPMASRSGNQPAWPL